MAFNDIPDPAAVAEATRGDALLSTLAGERASQGPGNKIVTYNGKTHIAWQDSIDQRYLARVRTLDHATGQWSPVAVLSEGVDEHSRPTLVVDSRGILHVVMGGHNSPLQYQHSLKPHDSSAWSPIVELGKNTYPVLLCGPDDTLHLTCRDGGHDGMEYFVKTPGGEWQSRGLLVRRQERFGGYTAMHNDMAWGPGQRTLHMSMGFFLSPRWARKDEEGRDLYGQYQAMGYMRSSDGGNTWQKADDSPVSLPATTDNLDVLDVAESNNPKPGIQHCGLAVDSQDRPYVGYVRHTPQPGGAHLLTTDAHGRWQPLPLRDAIDKAFPGWVATLFKPVMTGDDALCILAMLAPLEHPAANWNPGVFGRPAFWLREYEHIQRLVWLESSDLGQTFTAREAVPYDGGRGQVLPSIERPNGPHAIVGRRPSFIYTLGESRYAAEGETINNELYWVRNSLV